MNRRNGAYRTAAVLAVASLALAGCGSGDDGGDKKSSDASSKNQGNGTLTIGTLLPQTGDLAFLGPPEFAGVQLAVNDINAAGGVLGKDVTQIKSDSGDGTPDIAGAQVDKLLDADADVVVGAAASGVSLSVINKITDAGVVEFSPANTSPTFDDPKTDPHSLYFRTSPSDVLQGAVLANTVIEDGHNNVAILARQDSYGELLANELEKGVKAGGGTVAKKVLYSADATNYTAEINQVAGVKPDAIALIGFEETTKIIPAMIAKGIGPKNTQIYFVDGNTADYSKKLAPGTLTGVRATYPGAELKGDFKARLDKVDPKLDSYTYGPESYDATIMVALAAAAAKSDAPTKYAPEIIKISREGTKCTTFKQCADLLKKGEDIDYDGVSGPVDLGDTGSPTKATIGIFQYDAKNTFHSVKFVTGVI